MRREARCRGSLLGLRPGGDVDMIERDGDDAYCDPISRHLC